MTRSLSVMTTTTVTTTIPRQHQCGIYVLITDRMPESVKVGWTRDINQRIWHASYSAFRGKRYAYALLFEFDWDKGDATADTLHWVHACIESELKRDTHAHQDPHLATEWRRMSVHDAIQYVQQVVYQQLHLLPRSVRPAYHEYYNFCPPRYTVLDRRRAVLYLQRAWRRRAEALVQAKQRAARKMQRTWRRRAGVFRRRRRTRAARKIQFFWRDWQRWSSAETMVPYDYQQQDVDTLLTYFGITKPTFPLHMQHQRGHIVQACGVGKALLIVFLIRAWIQITSVDGPLFVIAVPSLRLLEQMLKEVRKVLRHVPLLCVGSHSHVCNTTDFRVIVQWNVHRLRKPRVMLTSYASVHALVEANVKACLVVADECHHLIETHEGTDTKKRSWSRFWDLATLDGDEPTRWLCLTATPDYDTSKPGTMSDASKFGPRVTACDRTVEWAIAHKNIVDYTLHTSTHRATCLKNALSALCRRGLLPYKIGKRYDLFAAAYDTVTTLLCDDQRRTAHTWVVGHPPTHALIYTNRIADARLVDTYVEALHAWFAPDDPLYHRALHSQLKRLDVEIATFRMATRGIVTSVQLFGEGFDMPRLGMVTFAAPIRATIRIIQYVLRAHRVDIDRPDKHALVCLPVVDGQGEYAQHILNVMETVDLACASRQRCAPGASEWYPVVDTVQHTLSDGSTYEGQWVDGVPHGRGTATNMEQAYTFTGQWANGWRVHGRETHTDWTYEGQYLVDEFHGRGMHDTHKARFIGTFDDGHFRHGRVVYPDGTIYKGQWSNYKMNGRGMRWQADGHTYSGEWCEGQLTNGQHVTPEQKYVGPFVNGQYAGRGTLIYEDGTHCCGWFRNGFLHGSGTMTRVGGQSAPCIWVEGKRVSCGAWVQTSVPSLLHASQHTSKDNNCQSLEMATQHKLPTTVFLLVLCQIRTQT